MVTVTIALSTVLSEGHERKMSILYKNNLQFALNMRTETKRRKQKRLYTETEMGFPLLQQTPVKQSYALHTSNTKKCGAKKNLEKWLNGSVLRFFKQLAMRFFLSWAEPQDGLTTFAQIIVATQQTKSTIIKRLASNNKVNNFECQNIPTDEEKRCSIYMMDLWEVIRAQILSVTLNDIIVRLAVMLAGNHPEYTKIRAIACAAVEPVTKTMLSTGTLRKEEHHTLYRPSLAAHDYILASRKPLFKLAHISSVSFT